MDPTFRLATDSDIDTLIGMMREFYAIDAYPFDEGAARRALEGLLRDPALGRVWLIHDGDTAIGYVVLTFGYSLEFHGRDAFVDELFVRPSHRRRGVGTRAMRLVEGVCRDLGVHALHLEVERANAVAQHLYRTFGLQDHARYLMTKWISR
jgi:ribosomal protein S18 acetylase RimI-like enzyme